MSFVSCSTKNSKVPTPDFQEISATGFVINKNGCYLLQTENEEFYPVNLEEQLRVDGLRVKFRYISTQSQPTQNCNEFQSIEIKEIIPYRK